MTARLSQDQRRPCRNPKCDQWNRPEARYCARCGTALRYVPGSTSAARGEAPHWGFVAIFIAFFAAVFLPLLTAVGPVMLIVVPVVLCAVMRGSGSRGYRPRNHQA